jgi:tetratricopeptide (TPR) repeat protein
MTRSSPVNSDSDQRRPAAGLIPLTGVSPRAALAAARAVLAAQPGPLDASIAHQAAAIVLRDFGDVRAAIGEFRVAVRLARKAADAEREADALTSLGTALVMAGRTEAGLAALGEAVAKITRPCPPSASPVPATPAPATPAPATPAPATPVSAKAELGRILVRRGGSLWIAGRYEPARADLRRAITLTRQAGEPVWEARARTALALADLAIGAVDRAEAGLAAAEALFAGSGQQLEIAYARHNRALVAFASGDLPAALRHLDDAAARYAELDVFVPDAALDRCAVLLAAGLPADALAAVEAALTGRVTATKKAELQLAAARIALAAGHSDQSAERAVVARSMFARQGREWWRAHATLVLVKARLAAGRPPGSLLREAERTAIRLGELASDETPDAWLLAGRLALAAASRPAASRPAASRPAVPRPAASRPAVPRPAVPRPAVPRPRRTDPADLPDPARLADADRLLASAARAARRRVPAFARAAGWLAEALRAEAAGDRRRLLTACGRGFTLLEEHLSTLGAAELRAHATAHGTELAELAQRAALRSGRPRLLLEWSERWRAVALQPPRPVADPGLRAELAALRDVTSRLEKAHPDSFPAAVLHRERLRLEALIRARTLRTEPPPAIPQAPSVPATPLIHAGAPPFDADALLAALGPRWLVELVVVDGDLHVLLCGDGAIRHFAAGSAADAGWEVDFARFGLNRLARGSLPEPPEQALAALADAGRRLDALLLGAARDQLGDGPVVVVPPGRLNAVPWALLPSLRDRAVSVAPSARAWLRASQPGPFGDDRTVLVAGPGLGAARAEVRTLARQYRDATVLGEGTATTARVLAAIDGAGLAHIAAHGRFRADSPMFSSLRLDDGPMTVHDVQRLRRAPRLLILPSCESGLLAPAGADELLGLASALLPLGTASIVASVAQVNDDAAAPLMLALHRRLQASGQRPGAVAAALCDARADVRQATADDPVMTAAGWSFIVLGA